MYELGMPTLIENKSIEDCAELCSRLGLEFIELNMNLPQYQTGAVDAVRYRALARERGIYYTIHLDENLNVSDFNPHVAEAYRRTVRETLVLASELGVPTLNMHMAHGVYFTLPDRKVYLFDTYREQYLDSMRAFRDECDTLTRPLGINICIENTNGYTDFEKQAVEILLESPVFALTYDIGHAHSSGSKDESFILSHADRLRHMHVHDSKEKKDHLVLGTGELDIDKYLRLADEHNCRVVLETKTVDGLEKSVEWLKNR